MSEMVEVTVSSLTGKALNWAVEQVEKTGSFTQVLVPNFGGDTQFKFSHLLAIPFSTSWHFGGPLIEKYGLAVEPGGYDWKGGDVLFWNAKEDGQIIGVHANLLVAVCRAVVQMKLGNVVSVPEVLLP